MSDYSDSHRLFVQAMLTKRSVTESEAKLLYDNVRQVTGRSHDVDYQMFISDINKELDFLDYSLKITHDERDGSAYLTFVNVKEDPFTETATLFKPAEISYCRELIERIINADNEDFAISAMKAIRLGNTLSTKLTQKETQELLDQLIKDKWIALEDKGVYYMNARAIAELSNYLREQYGDLIRECIICLDIITMGEKCRVENCPVRIHKYCAESQFGNTSTPTCPQCATPWDRENTFGLGLPNAGGVLPTMSEDEDEDW